jgi:hypothetical protein
MSTSRLDTEIEISEGPEETSSPRNDSSYYSILLSSMKYMAGPAHLFGVIGAIICGVTAAENDASMAMRGLAVAGGYFGFSLFAHATNFGVECIKNKCQKSTNVPDEERLGLLAGIRK